MITIDYKRRGDFAVMQATGDDPAELAEFVKQTGLIEVPLVIDPSDDSLADTDLSSEAAH